MAKSRSSRGAAAEAGGLGEDIPVPDLARAVQPSNLSDGVMAIFRHSDVRQGRMGMQKIHTFQLGQDFLGKRFALWGSVQLDLKLKTIDFGEVVFLQYGGKEDGERGQHRWTVRLFSGTSDQLKKLAAQYRAGAEEVALATEAPRASAPESGGDDLPF